jgi:hypothetical protein
LILAMAPILVAAAPAAAQFGPGGSDSRPWQFLGPGERVARVNQLDIMEKYRAGMYAPAHVTNNVTNTTNVAGDQYNCSVSASTSGNSGYTASYGATGAPTVLNSPTVSSLASGNDTTNEAGIPLNGGSASVANNQTNSGSSQTSTITGSGAGGVSGTIGGSRNYIDQIATNSQDLIDSPLNASVSGSVACATASSGATNSMSSSSTVTTTRGSSGRATR